MKIERRAYEHRVAIDTDSRVVSGYAAVWDYVADSGWGWRERIRPGAFAESLARNDDVIACVEHDPSLVVARRSGGTLKLQEDEKGLRYEFTPADTSIGRDLVENIRAGNIRGSSFGFRVMDEEIDRSDRENPLRSIITADLFDVSPVVFPFYDATTVDVRSCIRQEDAERVLSALREADTFERDGVTMRNRARIRLLSLR
jgi:hypothetical protein